MAIANFQHYMSGAPVINFDGEDLGVNRGPITGTVYPRFLNVPTDLFGGDDGVPADAQWMGAIARYPVAMTRYDLTAIEKVLRHVPLASVAYGYGQFPAIGTFVRQQGIARVLQFTSTNETRQFDTAFMRDPQEIDSATRYRTYLVTFECWLDTATAQQLWRMRNAADTADQAIGSTPNHSNTSNTVLA